MSKFDEKKFKAKNKYLKQHIYHGLTNLNTGWDAPSIFYFSEAEFEIVLNRVEELGLGIYGIEPWDYENHYYDVKTIDDESENPINSKWHRKAFSEFKATGEKLQYSASYCVPQYNSKTKL